MSFNGVADQVFGLYQQGDYLDALDVVHQARSDYPDEDNRLTFWEGCLLSRAGRWEEALDALEGGLERGEWWAPGVLSDDDLDPLRALPRWESILRRCTVITAELAAGRPAPLVRAGSGSAGSLVALQGAQGDQSEIASIWSDAAPSEWTVVTPVASEPNPRGGWGWPHSIEASVATVLADLNPLHITGPLVVAGFSVGSAIACHLALAGDVPVAGVIAVAPSSRSEFDEIRRLATEEVPALVVCGGQDLRVEHYRKLHADLAGDAHVTVDLVEGLGHEYPSDLSSRVGRFLGSL